MTFRQEELDQMLAPIALYPDQLLAQILMGATYPLEITQAAGWARANPGLSGDQLAMVLEQQDWDPSVKSLVNFPSVLQMMSDNLDWTQNLGDAFLAQQDQVMDTVQKLRREAMNRGNLVSTGQEQVVQDPVSQEILIQPASPEMMYVPVYDPEVAYGPWLWPGYPPFYYRPYGTIAHGFIAFRLAVPWGYAWGGFDWRSHRVMIDVKRHLSFNHLINPQRYQSSVAAGHGVWTHDPTHRRGFAYRSTAVAQKYGRQGSGAHLDARQEFRGFDHGGPGPAGPSARPMQPPAGRPAAAPPSSVAGAGERPQRPAAAFGSPYSSSQIQEASTRGRESMRIAQGSSPPPRVNAPPPRVVRAPAPRATPPSRPAGGSGGQGRSNKKK
jgi:hypothetical protein